MFFYLAYGIAWAIKDTKMILICFWNDINRAFRSAFKKRFQKNLNFFFALN